MSNGPKGVVEVFTHAIQLPADERAAYLDRACSSDAELLQEVLMLLQAHDSSGSFLERTPNAAIVENLQESSIAFNPGDRVGRYKILNQIGEGGCGVVYSAEQAQPIRRLVALKIIKPGMDTKSVVARFEAERQALALMDHPSIAKVFDAGATESGRPYFVMELIRGVKITDYCDQNSLPTEERLGLFIQVCQAVQHAHQKGIIHRDIKPSNILVATTPGGAALPVVIDFGIAKATTNQKLTDKTLFTALEMLIGTPAYMSPEQAALTGIDVDTRTDIYSLGVLLYELLTGSTPFDGGALVKAGVDEIRRTIREKDPARPSTKLGKMARADITAIAQFRRSKPSTLILTMRGDLDWIVMKALEKDRRRRYETANGLAMDVQRYLADEAISARPPNQLYKVRKTVARNKLLFGSVVVITLLLTLSLIIVSASLAKERQSRQEAVAASGTSQQITRVLEDMLNDVGPAKASGLDPAIFREILDQTTERLGKETTIQPVVEAKLRSLIGKLYEQIGDLKQAEDMERGALVINQRIFGPESLEAAASLNDLGLEFMAQHKLPEAEKAHSEALAIRRHLLGEEDPDTATSLNDLGAVYRDESRLKEAEPMAREALQIRIKRLGTNNLEVADSLRNLSIILGSESKWSEAKKTAEEVLAMRRNLLGPDHPYIADSLEDVAWAASGMHQYKEAEQDDAEALALRHKRLGDAHPDIGRNLNALGQLIYHQNDLPTADAVLRATLSIQRSLVGEDNPATLDTLHALGRALDSEGKFTEAESVLQEALAIWNKKNDDENDERLYTLRDLGDTFENEKKWPEAATVWRESLAPWRKRNGIDGQESMYTLRKLGLALMAERKWPQAESVWHEALSISSKKGDDDPEALADLGRLVSVLASEKRFADAQQLLDKMLTPALMTQPSSADLLAARAGLMGRQGRWQEAADDALLVLKNQPDDHYHYHRLAALLVETHQTVAYQKLCQTLVAKFPNPENPYVAERITQDCLLLPNSGVDLEVIDKVADTAVQRGSGDPAMPYFLACKEMSAYRRRHFREAIDWGGKAVNSPGAEAQARAKAFAVLAMADWQLGQKSAARTALSEGDALAPGFSAEQGANDLGESWLAWLMARISLDEATALIQPVSPKTNDSNKP
jgi:serine/threonine protein kinase